jgi:hypothetical protein
VGEERQIAVLEGHVGWLQSAAFSPDGKWVVTVSGADNSVQIWDVATGQVIHENVQSAAFSPDGKRAVTESSPHRERAATESGVSALRLWNVSTGQQMATLEGHTNWVRSVAFSRDGRRIVTGADDHTARIWDAKTGEQIAAMEGHTQAVNSAVFSPDGRQVVTASDDESARIWDVSRSATIVGERSIVLTAALGYGLGWRTDSDRIDLLMQDAEDDLFAEALKQLGRATDDPVIGDIAAQLRVPLHPNCYMSPTQFVEKFDTPPASTIKSTDSAYSVQQEDTPEESPAQAAKAMKAVTTSIKLSSETTGAVCHTIPGSLARQSWILRFMLTWGVVATAVVALLAVVIGWASI